MRLFQFSGRYTKKPSDVIISEKSLDEHLNLRPNQVATPSLTEALVDTATKLSFRKTAEEVHKYTAGVLCASTVHRLLQRVTQDMIQKEKMEWEACFKRGVIPPPGRRKALFLLTCLMSWMDMGREQDYLLWKDRMLPDPGSGC